MYYVYIVECKDSTFYTGITTDVKRRFQEHISGRGGSYTKAKKVKKLLYTEECKDRSTALKREAQIKGWNRKKKLALINQKYNNKASPEFAEGLKAGGGRKN